MQVDITFHPSWWHKNAKVSFNKEFFYDAEYRIEADIEMRKTLFKNFGDLGFGEKSPEPRPIIGSDLIASGFLHSEILGCEVKYSDENPPEVLCKNLDDDEISKLTLLDLDKSELWGKIEKQLVYLKNRFDYAEPCVNLMGIQNIALDLRGSELFVDYHINPELAHHLLNICTELSIDIAKRLTAYSENISAGVTAIVKKTLPNAYVTSNCSVEMISLENYTNFLLQYDEMLAKAFIPFGIHHCGKTMEHVVDGYKRISNLKFAEVGAFSDLAYVRKQLSDIHLNARFSPVTLKDSSIEMIEKDVGKLVIDGNCDQLLSVSCVGIDADVPIEQIRNFIEICKKVK